MASLFWVGNAVKSHRASSRCGRKHDLLFQTSDCRERNGRPGDTRAFLPAALFTL